MKVDRYVIKLANEIVIKKFSDPRTKFWFLASNPGPLFLIIAAYLVFCLYAGPRYMKNRNPFQLKNAIIVYNAIQVVLSAVIVHEVSLKLQNTEAMTM